MSRPLAALSVAAVLWAGVVAADPAVALAQDDSTEFTADETAGDIDRIRVALYAIAAATGTLLVLYIWHTNPRRRMDVAVRRRAAREQEQLDSLDDAFVLPADAEADLDGGATDR